MAHYRNSLKGSENQLKLYFPLVSLPGSMNIKNLHRCKKTMYLKLSREYVVYSVICVLFIVVAVTDVMPRRPGSFTETKIKRKNKKQCAV